MTTQNFKSFLSSLILEALHPELQELIGKRTIASKQGVLAKKIKDLSARGEKTGLEGNMPKGSSRAYLQHEDLHNTTVDGKAASLKVGTKVAIRANLDKHHHADDFDGLSLGEMQNRAEGGDHFINQSYRTLTAHPSGRPNEFVSNKEGGIFPPLIDHDHETNQWTHIGHAENVSQRAFRDLTKNKDYPAGISHGDFVEALVREHLKNTGRYWDCRPEHEAHLDKVLEHPLTQKFNDYHGMTGHPPHDLGQIRNMGVWTHPDGSKHIVARDHGFDTEVNHAYKQARMARVDAKIQRINRNNR